MRANSDVDLGRECCTNMVGLPRLSEDATVDEVVELTGLMNCRDAFLEAFGGPAPTNAELALIHCHASANTKQLELLIGDKERAKSLCEIGKLATAAATAVAVYDEADEYTGAQEINTKVAFIGASHAMFRSLHERGLCRVIVGVGMLSSTAGNERGIFSVCQEVAHRYAGHLFLTRQWDEFVRPFRTMLDVPTNFPFGAYSEANTKSTLQHWAQHALDSVPRYDVVDEWGPDHDKRFRVVVWGGKTGRKRLGEGEGRTVKEAEMAAASDALATVAHPVETKTKQLQFAEPPEWLKTRCEGIGTQVLAEVTDLQLSTQFQDAVLIPRCKQGAFRSHLLRERLGVVGSRVRELMAFRHAVMNQGTCSEATAQVNFINNNRNLCEIVTNSPLGNWIDALRRSDRFEAIDQRGPLIDTLNALLGALVIQYGFGGTKSVEALLFSNRRAKTPAMGSARSKLQQVIQEVVKDQFSRLFELEVAQRHKPNEAHRARIEVTIRLAGAELSRAEAGNKKEAAERAAEKALVNPRLSEILNGFRKS